MSSDPGRPAAGNQRDDALARPAAAASTPPVRALNGAPGRLITRSGETARPNLKSIALAPGEAKDLEFVPVRTGAYELECTAPLHSVLGMHGTILIR